jgi:pyridoxal phosphate enzyme (YggS family)
VTRLDDLAANLATVRESIAAACEGAGRAPEEVTLVAVTKTFPSSDVRLLAELGVRDIGENRDQEARGKAEDCADLDVAWHFVGQLQTNKAKSVARYATVVHSVDRPELVAALAKSAANAERELRCLVQVSLDAEPGRGGVRPDEARSLADEIAKADRLELGGVMAVAPLDEDPDRAFERLEDIAASIRSAHPAATWISAGMSDDLAAAIAHGATHVRIGRKLLGQRPPLR